MSEEASEAHVNLIVEREEGRQGIQPVSVRYLSDGTLEVLYSPGFDEGIAAGDVIRPRDEKTGAFDVVRRAGNASKIFRDGLVALRWKALRSVSRRSVVASSPRQGRSGAPSERSERAR